MQILRKTLAIGLLFASITSPTHAQEAVAAAPEGQVAEEAAPAGPTGTFIDQYGTSFEFSLCGPSGTDLCGLLLTLEGESATPENLTFVGKQVMQAAQTGPNEWKGSLTVGDTSADATVRQTGPDTVEIEGCRAAILCQTLAYQRAS